jgi:tyrosyl-tRNA synthetase
MSQEKHIDELLSRSIFQILPSKEKLKEVLLSGKKLRIYVGADATGPQLHIGHATNFMLLEKLRQLGHEVIVLFGDFTAMLGDPTDKSSARKQLSRDEVNANISTWKEQVSKVLDFSDAKNPAIIQQNSEWLSGMDLSNVVNLASHFTVQQMLERDMFEKRMEEGKPIHLHEFLYPLLQGYDSVALDVDIEMGGSDQIFNMLAGRTLQKAFHTKEKFVIATTLLENPLTGKKLMSKSEGGFVALNDVPNDMFGKIMALPDEVIRSVFIDCTYLSLEEIEAVLKSENPRDTKLRLGREIVTIYHGEEAARAAEEYFVATFSKHEIPTDIREVKLSGEMSLLDFLVQEGFAASKAEARRKVEQGGVEIDGEKVLDWGIILTKQEKPAIIKCGKKDFARVVF